MEHPIVSILAQARKHLPELSNPKSALVAYRGRQHQLILDDQDDTPARVQVLKRLESGLQKYSDGKIPGSKTKGGLEQSQCSLFANLLAEVNACAQELGTDAFHSLNESVQSPWLSELLNTLVVQDDIRVVMEYLRLTSGHRWRAIQPLTGGDSQLTLIPRITQAINQSENSITLELGIYKSGTLVETKTHEAVVSRWGETVFLLNWLQSINVLAHQLEDVIRFWTHPANVGTLIKELSPEAQALQRAQSLATHMLGRLSREDRELLKQFPQVITEAVTS